MTSKQMVKDKLEGYERKGLFGRNASVKRLSGSYLEKARHNLETADILLSLSESSAAKATLKVSASYAAYDWVIVSAYYAMYHAALGALAFLGCQKPLVRYQRHDCLTIAHSKRLLTPRIPLRTTHQQMSGILLFKSDDHEATRTALLYYCVLEGQLESKYVAALDNARKLEEEYIQKLYNAKRTRQTAQYSVNEEFSKSQAGSLIGDAQVFMNRIAELLK